MKETQRKEPIISAELAVPERDDKHIYGKKGSSGPSYAGGQTSWLTRVVLLIVFIALGAVAFWGIQLQNELNQSKQKLAEYDKVIMALREKLDITDESINQSSAQADDRLKQLDSEIRKLWDNVWKKSRKRLDSNEAGIAALKNQQASFLKTINEQTELLSTIDLSLGAISENFPVVQADAAEAKKATGTLVSSIESVRADVQSLRSQQLGLAAQSEEFEEWIESINGYRKSVNRRLSELEAQMNSPTAAPTPAAATTP